MYIGGCHYLEELVRCVILQAPYLASGVVERDTLGSAELNNAFLVETFFAFYLKVMPVAVEDMPENPPHVVNPVGVEKLHRPSCSWRWETA